MIRGFQRWRPAAAYLALCAALSVLLLGALGQPARAAGQAQPAAAGHVVVVGISGLTWSSVTRETMPELWRLAAAGSVGSLVDYAQQPLSCSSDGWLTLNSAARAQGPRPCAALPAVVSAGGGARIPAMPAIVRDNARYHQSPAWGLLGRLVGCSTAVGPGAALALASAAGVVPSYLPSAASLSRSVLARCPLTVIDLGQIAPSERARASAIDRQLAQLAAELPAGTLLLVTAPGAATGPGPDAVPAGPPHLESVVVHGPGFAAGLLDSASTRRPGIVALTDLTPTVAGWLGQPVPAGTVGARITRADRGSLTAAVSALNNRDTAEQVWIATHGWFFTGYAAAVAVAFGIPALLLRGRDEERRRRRARCWRLAGLAAAAVPLASYLANVPPWWELAHPAWWLYGMSAGWTLAVTAAALAGPWRRDPLGPFGAVAAATLLLLAVDVISGSRLQLEAPFGLSLLVSGRYYGIGNDVLGVYCISTLVAAGWVARLLRDQDAEPLAGSPQGEPLPRGGAPEPLSRDRELERLPRGSDAKPLPPRGAAEPLPSGGDAEPSPRGVAARRPAAPAAAAAVVGLLAVVASGWPGFGAKAGGTIALVPCVVLLVAWLSGARTGRRWAVPVAVSGLVLFLAFAIISYLLPAAGVSDIGSFAGDLLHGRAGDLLSRKASADVGSLTLSVFGWLIPVAAVLAAAALRRPAALRLRTLAGGFAADPLVRVLARLAWLALVIGWFADDQGVIVPAAALPFAVPLVIAMAAAVYLGDRRAADG